MSKISEPLLAEQFERRLLNALAVCALGDFSLNTLDRLIARGLLPQPLRLSPRCNRWWSDEVEAALAALPRRSPAQKAAAADLSVRFTGKAKRRVV
jgi:predicted DNA-binding transcriptional regulator AlpA